MLANNGSTTTEPRSQLVKETMTSPRLPTEGLPHLGARPSVGHGAGSSDFARTLARILGCTAAAIAPRPNVSGTELRILRIAAERFTNTRKGEKDAQQVVHRPRLYLRVVHPTRERSFRNSNTVGCLSLRQADPLQRGPHIRRREQMQMQSQGYVDLVVHLFREDLLPTSPADWNLQFRHRELVEPSVVPNLGIIRNRFQHEFSLGATRASPREGAIPTTGTLEFVRMIGG